MITKQILVKSKRTKEEKVQPANIILPVSFTDETVFCIVP